MTTATTSPSHEQLNQLLATMSRADRYELASQIITDICYEWDVSDDATKWQEANVEEYESHMSFDELAAEVRSVSFKRL